MTNAKPGSLLHALKLSYFFIKYYLQIPKERYRQDNVSVRLAHSFTVKHSPEVGLQYNGRSQNIFQRALLRCSHSQKSH